MSLSDWYPIIATLIGGGAMGAIITIIISSYRNRIQPIGRRIEIIPLFKGITDISSVKPLIAIFDGETYHQFENLYIVRIQLVNSGNTDIPEFQVGITVAEDDLIISVQPDIKDRHHEIDILTDISYDKPNSELDLIFRPLNRGDSYFLDLFIVISQGKSEPGILVFSTPHPIKFVDILSVKEILTEIVIEGPSIIGMYRILLRRGHARSRYQRSST